MLGRDFADFVVLLSLGFGPLELLELLDEHGSLDDAPAPVPSPALRSLVKVRHPDRADVSPAQILAYADEALPGFEALVETWVD